MQAKSPALLLLLASANAFSQYTGPIGFIPLSNPVMVYAGTEVWFGVQSVGSVEPTSFVLLEGPTNVWIGEAGYGGRPSGYWVTPLVWSPPRESAGSTNRFSVAAHAFGDPLERITNTFEIVVLDPPAIRSIRFTNRQVVLTLGDLLPDKVYGVLRSPDLSGTNWSHWISISWPAASSITLTDTNPPASAQYYQLVPAAVECRTDCP